MLNNSTITRNKLSITKVSKILLSLAISISVGNCREDDFSVLEFNNYYNTIFTSVYNNIFNSNNGIELDEETFDNYKRYYINDNENNVKISKTKNNNDNKKKIFTINNNDSNNSVNIKNDNNKNVSNNIELKNETTINKKLLLNRKRRHGSIHENYKYAIIQENAEKCLNSISTVQMNNKMGSKTMNNSEFRKYLKDVTFNIIKDINEQDSIGEFKEHLVHDSFQSAANKIYKSIQKITFNSNEAKTELFDTKIMRNILFHVIYKKQYFDDYNKNKEKRNKLASKTCGINQDIRNMQKGLAYRTSILKNNNINIACRNEMQKERDLLTKAIKEKRKASEEIKRANRQAKIINKETCMKQINNIKYIITYWNEKMNTASNDNDKSKINNKITKLESELKELNNLKQKYGIRKHTKRNNSI